MVHCSVYCHVLSSVEILTNVVGDGNAEGERDVNEVTDKKEVKVLEKLCLEAFMCKRFVVC